MRTSDERTTNSRWTMVNNKGKLIEELASDVCPSVCPSVRQFQNQLLSYPHEDGHMYGTQVATTRNGQYTCCRLLAIAVTVHTTTLYVLFGALLGVLRGNT